MSPQPNILLIMSDEHAAAYSGTYGHPLVQTPSMDRLAAAGVTFDNTYCNKEWHAKFKSVVKHD